MIDPESAHAFNVAPMAKSYEERVTPKTVERICRACRRVHGKYGWNPRHIAQYDEPCERCDCIDQEQESKLTGKHCLSCKRPLGINDVEQRVRSDYREHLERAGSFHKGHIAGSEFGRKEERAAIVAWLRKWGNSNRYAQERGQYNETMLIRAIENGEHHK